MFPNWAATQAENTNVTLGKHIFKAGFDSGFSLKVSDSHINMKPVRWNWLSVSSAVIKHCYGLQKDSCRVLWLTLYFFLCSFFSIFSFNLTTIFVKYSGQLMAVKLLAFGFNVHFSQKEGFFLVQSPPIMYIWAFYSMLQSFSIRHVLLLAQMVMHWSPKTLNSAFRTTISNILKMH